MCISGPKILSMLCELGEFLVAQMELCENFKYQSIPLSSHLVIEINYLKLEKNYVVEATTYTWKKTFL